MQLYYESMIDSVDIRIDGDICHRKASDQMVVDAAAEILKKKTGKDIFEIDLGNEKSTD